MGLFRRWEGGGSSEFKCSLIGHPLPHTLVLLTGGLSPLNQYPWGIITPSWWLAPRTNNRTPSAIIRYPGDYQSLDRIITSNSVPLGDSNWSTQSVTPFPLKCSSYVVCLHNYSRSYGLGILTTYFCVWNVCVWGLVFYFLMGDIFEILWYASEIVKF